MLGLIFIVDGYKGMGDVQIYTGKLKVVTPAKDEALGLTDMGPVIFRNTSMYQYVMEARKRAKGFSKNSDYYGVKQMYSEPVDDFYGWEEQDGSRKWKHFKNPEFPNAFLDEYGYGNTALYGDVEIGDTGVKLDRSLLRFF